MKGGRELEGRKVDCGSGEMSVTASLRSEKAAW